MIDRHLGCRLLVPLLVTGAWTLAAVARADSPGGFIEKPETAQARPALRSDQIQQFLPPTPGPFTFPPPYNTRGVRLTGPGDCAGGDCVWSVGYSYWRNINNHSGSGVLYFFLGLDRERGGKGPTLFRYDKVTEEVRRLGPLFPETSHLSWLSGEGWYFSATHPGKLYVDDGARMLRYDIGSTPGLPLGPAEVVFDVRPQFGTDKVIGQMQSSGDDRVHSATLKRLPSYEMLGCVVYHEVTRTFQYFPRRMTPDNLPGTFDECAVDKSGQWAMSLEYTQHNPPEEGLDMRIFNLATGAERIVLDQEGAVGHYDMGHGYVVGADNLARSNAIKLWDFSADPLSGRLVSYNDETSAPGPNHLSHTNAKAGVAAHQQYICGSGAADSVGVWTNEVICFRPDGAFNVLVVAPVMTNMAPSFPGDDDDYLKVPKGNLDVTGQYFLWTSNTGGARVDAFLVKVPAQRMFDGAPDGGSGGTPQNVIWTSLVNVTASGHSLQKTGGCDGCQDAGAVSQQQITAGDGYMEFRASELNLVRFIGLNNANPGTTTGEIPFAIKLVNGHAEAYESGQYRGDTTFATGDTLRIAVQSGVVRYSKNATVFYTSTMPPIYPLRVDTALTSAGSTINSVVISTGSSSTPPPGGVGPQNVSWTSLVNVTAEGHSIRKSGGCDGCQDAGAVSAQQITAGDGYMEFTASELNLVRFVGLNNGNPGTTAGEIPFAIKLVNGHAEAYERGQYRGDTTFTTGDKLRIAVQSGVVRYSKNGTVFYTSAMPPTYPLVVDTALTSAAGTITQVVISGGR